MFSNCRKVKIAFTFMPMALLWCLTLVGVSLAETNVISEVTWDREGATQNFEFRISGNQDPIYTIYELFGPQRIVLDIASGSFSEALVFPLAPPSGPVAHINGQIVTGQGDDIARLELYLDATKNVSYTVKKIDSELVVTFVKIVAESRILDTETSVEAKITDIQVDAIAPEKAMVVIYSSGLIGQFQTEEEGKTESHSARLRVDLPDVNVEEKIIPVALDSPLALIQARSAENGRGGYLILDSADSDLFAYDIKVVENYMEISLTSKAVGTNEDSEMVALLTGYGAEGSADEEFLAFTEDSPELATMAFSEDENTVLTPEMPDISNTTFAGYGEQKITVDFYKIDLHNVFRLIGEISNKNIIVDESVGGSLTLAMKDVPWDFLLDVVLNLKDLEKEERFNTIVISPSSEGFVWPESVATELDVVVEPITVTKRLQTSKDKIVAKKLIYQGRQLFENGDIKGALDLYEKAFLTWPENGDLANRIATIALVKLGQNAKAAHYSKIALQENPENYRAALVAAMSLANMEQTQESKEYFDIAVSGIQPTRQAIASYAAFSEQNGSYDAALSLLDQYDHVFGTTLETMISRARIYESMGDGNRADSQYQQILLSGYELPEDLQNYLNNRINGAQ